MSKIVTGDCSGCESYFELSFEPELVYEKPEFCPFCGEAIETPMEEYIEDDDDFDENEEWK